MLGGLDIFSSLSIGELEKISIFCQEKLVASWETLFSLWEEANAMYIVKSWGLKVIDENKKKLGQVWVGEILGEMVVFWGEEKRTASVVAIEDSALITILSFSIKELAENNHEIFVKIKDIIEERRWKNSGL